jgi:hypothetical protein
VKSSQIVRSIRSSSLSVCLLNEVPFYLLRIWTRSLVIHRQNNKGERHEQVSATKLSLQRNHPLFQYRHNLRCLGTMTMAGRPTTNGTKPRKPGTNAMPSSSVDWRPSLSQQGALGITCITSDSRRRRRPSRKLLTSRR